MAGAYVNNFSSFHPEESVPIALSKYCGKAGGWWEKAIPDISRTLGHGNLQWYSSIFIFHQVPLLKWGLWEVSNKKSKPSLVCSGFFGSIDLLCDCLISESALEMNVFSNWENLLIGPLVYRVVKKASSLEESHMEAFETSSLWSIK